LIHRCTDADVPAIDAIINEAATAYRGVIPGSTADRVLEYSRASARDVRCARARGL